MIISASPPRVGDQVQAGLYSLVTGTLVWAGERNASVQVDGFRHVFPLDQVLMLSERLVTLEGVDETGSKWAGPIERAREHLSVGYFEGTSITGTDDEEHIGLVRVEMDGSSWVCHWRCPCKVPLWLETG